MFRSSPAAGLGVGVGDGVGLGVGVGVGKAKAWASESRPPASRRPASPTTALRSWIVRLHPPEELLTGGEIARRQHRGLARLLRV